MTRSPRICSLLPSATEIVCALGLSDSLVAVTHECDYPPVARTKPHVTTSVIQGVSLSAAEIDRQIRDALAENATIYHLDRDLLEELRPDIILTQDLCTVCAVGTSEVQEVVDSLSHQPEVVSLEPQTLDEVLDSILLVGCRVGELRRAVTLVDELRGRLDAVKEAVAESSRPRVLALEWIDPIFLGGHWVPDMVTIAGGHDVLGISGEPSRECRWDEVVATHPEIVIGMPCGFGLARSVKELSSVELLLQWHELPAVKEERVYAVDGSDYFNRPGPRLADGVEILASIIHPTSIRKFPSDSFLHLSRQSAVV